MILKEYGSDFHSCEFKKNQLKISLPKRATFFGCGRYAINFLINHYMSLGQWKCIYMPEFFCYHVIHSIKKTGITIKYYPDYPYADDVKIISEIPFVEGDVLLRMNYFGLRNYKDNSKINVPVIEDHSHSIFSSWALRSNADWCVASLRKTIPVPDGGILWSPKRIKKLVAPPVTKDHKELVEKRFNAMILKRDYLKGIGSIDKQEFVRKFAETEDAYVVNAISGISEISKAIVKNTPSIIYEQKQENYDQLVSLLELKNVSILEQNKWELPYSLVLLFNSKKDRDVFRTYLLEHNVYPSIIWPVDNKDAKKEILHFADIILSIPVDFRYSKNDIIHVSEIINEGILNINSI